MKKKKKKTRSEYHFDFSTVGYKLFSCDFSGTLNIEAQFLLMKISDTTVAYCSVWPIEKEVRPRQASDSLKPEG